MNSIISIIIIISTLLFYNRLYFFFYKEKVVFFKYLKNFIIYTFVICFLIIIFGSNWFKTIDNNFIQSSLSTYFIIFLVLFFNISTKSYESPTVLIYNLIKKNGDTYQNILKKLKKKNLVKIRIKDLLKQKLLIKKGNKLYLSSIGKKFSSFYLFLKNFYKIKSQG